MPEEIIEVFKKILEGVLKGDEEDLKRLHGDKSYIDMIFENIKGTAKLLQDKEKLVAFIEYAIPMFINNIDKLLTKVDIVDNDLLAEFQELLSKCYTKNRDLCWEISKSYLKEYKTKYPIDKLTWTLLIYQNNRKSIYQFFETTPFTDIEEKLESFFLKLIDENKEEEFKLYFFDWVLKFGYLIEGYIKEILITQLKFHCLLMGQDFEQIHKRFLTVGRLVRFFGADRILSFYRNAIFHSNFLVNYELNLNERKVIFKGLYGRAKECTIKGFFNKIFQVN